VAQRDSLVRASAPLLDPGEEVASIAKALEGPNRWAGMGLSLVVAFTLGILSGIPILALPVFLLMFSRLYAKRLILATDEGVVVLGCGRFSWKPRQLLSRLPVDTRIGPLKGLWLQTVLDGRRLFVQPRWVAEVTAADADLT